jgi:membrane-bound lytic murein transglycosylase B
MIQLRITCAVLLSLLVGAFALPGQAADPPEQEARAAFAKVLDAAKKKQVDQFKQWVAKDGLRELEAAEKKGAKPFDKLMAALAPHDAQRFTAEVKGGQVTFIDRSPVKTATGTMDQVAAFTMVREGSQWKLSLD